MWVLGTLTDKNVNLFKNNRPCGGSPEDTVKVYAPSSGLPYNKVNIYATVVSLMIENMWSYTPRLFTKRHSQFLHTGQ